MDMRWLMSATVVALFWCPALSAKEVCRADPELYADYQSGGRTLTAVEQRILAERKESGDLFSFIAHRPTYILPASYVRDTHHESFTRIDGDPDHAEIKFQISFKVPLCQDILSQRFSLYGGYTQVSFWQAYNKAASSPFRESNYEPELILYHVTNGWSLGSVKLPLIAIGAVHQSNGQSGSMSRSWNRAYLDFIFSMGDLGISYKPWVRFREPEKEDDNRDIHRFMGHGELRVAYKYQPLDMDTSVLLRNNLKSGSDNRGAVMWDASWDIEWSKKLSLYTQVFYGFGESLIEYNHRTRRIGFGFLMTGWL